MSKNLVSLNMSLIEAMIAISQGNPGAAVSLGEICSTATKTDPDSAFGPFGPVLAFDTHGIYGSSIYVLHSEICKKNPVHTLAVLRAVQMGILSEHTLKEACSRQDRTGGELIKPGDLLAKVQKQLPNFGKE